MEFKPSIIKELIGAMISEWSERYDCERDVILEMLILESMTVWTLFEKNNGEADFKNILSRNISRYYELEKFLLENDKAH